MTISVSMLFLLLGLSLVGWVMLEWGGDRVKSWGKALMWTSLLVAMLELAKHHF